MVDYSYPMPKLYLASGSAARQSLLSAAQIPFISIAHTADERSVSWDMPIDKLVERLAVYKMEHLIAPQAAEGEIAYFLTADTLTLDMQGTIYGKPANKEEAITMIRALRDGATVATGFCLEKRVYTNQRWSTVNTVKEVVTATVVSDIPDRWINYYLDNVDFMSLAGALSVDGFGALFTKECHGSYSAILGLPLTQLRHALHGLGFFDGLP